MITRGSGYGLEGSSLSDNEIHDWIDVAVLASVRVMISEMFEDIKGELIALFDGKYVVVASTTAVAATAVVSHTTPTRGWEVCYQEFNNTKPPEFHGIKDPIAEMRWISDVEGCFYTCSCLDNLKFRYAQNLLRS